VIYQIQYWVYWFVELPEIPFKYLGDPSDRGAEILRAYL
jgi:hypothetical protein